jgi:hypothetical protein
MGILIFIIALGATLEYICVDGYNRLVAQRNRYNLHSAGYLTSVRDKKRRGR